MKTITTTILAMLWLATAANAQAPTLTVSPSGPVQSGTVITVESTNDDPIMFRVPPTGAWQTATQDPHEPRKWTFVCPTSSSGFVDIKNDNASPANETQVTIEVEDLA